MTAKNYADQYQANVITNTGTLSNSEYTAALNLFTSLINSFLMDKAIAFGASLGGNLTASLTNMYHISGTTSLTNNNFVNGDYDTTKGVYITATNTTKFLQTGITPSSQGLSNTNFSMLMYNTDSIIHTTDSIMMGLNNVSGTCEARIGQTGAITSTVRVLAPRPSCQGIVCNGASSRIYSDFVQQQLPFTTPALSLNTEITLFKGIHSTVTKYSNGGYGFYWIGQGLDDFQYKLLVKYINKFMEDCSRRSTNHALCVIGDSITYYTNATLVSNTYSNMLASHYNLIECNMGISGNTMNYSNAVGNDGFFRYCDLQWYKVGRNYPQGRVHFQLGVNDANGGDGATNGTQSKADLFQANIQSFLYYCINVLGIPIANITIGSIGYTSAVNSTKSAMYSLAAQNAATAYGVAFKDIYNYPGWSDSNLSDTIHPNDSGHLLYYNAII